MRYLVIGDANSMHIFNFVKTFLLPRGYEIHLLTLSTQPVRDEYKNFYKENNITLHSIAEKGYEGLNNTSKPYRLLNLWRKMKLMRDVPQVDICHVHSVYKTSVAMVLRNKKKFKKLILSYWGGDVENRDPRVIKLRERAFKIADAITVTVEQTLNDFHEVHGNAFDDKLSISRFATFGLNCIKGLSDTSTREECRKAYNVPNGKILITCGYSAAKEQRQEKCLAALQALPREMKDKIHVVVPMQYCIDDIDHFENIKRLQNEVDFHCEVLTDYVPFEMSAKLAVATDIYLHLRDTDAFSNALKEHVCAGSFIITGTWLRYIELENMKAPLRYISDFSQLTETLEDVLSSYSIPDGINFFNPIYELYSTESIIKQWDKVVNSVL